MQQNSEHVNITLKTVIYDVDSGEQETQEQSFTGEWTKKGSIDVLKYKEVNEEVGTIQNMIMIRPERVSIKRTGVIQMNQQFQLGQKTENIYQHMHGNMHMETFTESISFKEDTMPRALDMNYTMKLNEQLERKHQLKLQFSTK
ncbi:DUF1934 domain-containing protein [Oceanobacillus jeddahense]|uniref:DUF1934 domain-containing protein n=1 Tax=Oceanobacillus jeddahense TaxID=1462527 RepID=A0ABY5JU19_9BACI|nr:DUF1934 domain-containing protein [Oceanobacillus jeddahense]UUI02663.1 DUF1934 domain-containing protein [Oceanobacillus jeddahense]